MLDTLQKMSGTTHRVFADGKSVTQDASKMFMKNEAKMTISVSVKEMPTITYNDMAFISERNSIVFRAGDSPIWNRNETILPMSWRLFKDTIVNPGKEYTLQTIPTLSSVLDFDVRKNIPDFVKMWEKRKKQAGVVPFIREQYQKAYGYSDLDIERLDPDNYSDDIMALVNEYILQESGGGEQLPDDMDEMDKLDAYDDELDAAFMDSFAEYEDNDEQAQATAEAQARRDQRDTPRFAGGMLAPSDLVDGAGRPIKNLEADILKAFRNARAAFEKDTAHFAFMPAAGGKGQHLVHAQTRDILIEYRDEYEDRKKAYEASLDEKLRAQAFSDDITVDRKDAQEKLREVETLYPTDEFYRFLAGRQSWHDLAGGRFEAEMARLMANDDD